MTDRELEGSGAPSGIGRIRATVAIGGSVYLVWWFMVELLLPGSFNPLPGRLLVVAFSAISLGASYKLRWAEAHLSGLLTAWCCLLVAHYCYLIVGNHGDVTWWMGTFVTFAAVSMCLQSPREVLIFSLVAMGCVLVVASLEQQLAHAIYVPGLATILLLANITKRIQARAQHEVMRAREAAESANRDLEAFSYSVAHDLRAPLRRIDGFSQALQDEYAPALEAAGRDYIDRIQRNSQLMGQLIDALLELGRITRVDIRVQRVDLSALARGVAQRLKEFEPDRAVEFVIDEGLTEQGDSALLGAVVENLLSNAWKFTRKRSKARIEFGSRRDRGQTVYFVRDNGAGFDMASASKLFGVFQRLHSQEEFAGTGVGLATVHRIVHRHGGRIWAEGKVGEGASFHFMLGSASDQRARGLTDAEHQPHG